MANNILDTFSSVCIVCSVSFFCLFRCVLCIIIYFILMLLSVFCFDGLFFPLDEFFECAFCRRFEIVIEGKFFFLLLIWEKCLFWKSLDDLSTGVMMLYRNFTLFGVNILKIYEMVFIRYTLRIINILRYSTWIKILHKESTLDRCYTSLI